MVELPSGSSSVDFDLGFEVKYCLVGVSYFSLCYGSSDHHVKEMGISISQNPNTTAARKRFQITATLKDDSNHSLSGSQNYIGVSLVAFLESEGLDQKLYALNGFHVKYPDDDDHHLNGYGVTMGQDTVAASGGTISGHAYMEDGSGHRSVENASFTSVLVSSEILDKLEEKGIYFISGFELSKEDGDHHVYRTGVSVLPEYYCGISDKHEDYADVREIRVNQTHTTSFLDLISTLERKGEHHTVHAETGVVNLVESHFQGVICKDDIFVMSHNQKGYSRGRLVVVPMAGSKAESFAFDTEDEHFNHPGGMQKCGDYMAAAIEIRTTSSPMCGFMISQDFSPKRPRRSSFSFWIILTYTAAMKRMETAARLQQGCAGCRMKGIIRICLRYTTPETTDVPIFTGQSCLEMRAVLSRCSSWKQAATVTRTLRCSQMPAAFTWLDSVVRVREPLMRIIWIFTGWTKALLSVK